MKPYKGSFNGHAIEISENGVLLISLKEIEYEHNSQNNTWSSIYLPYSQYDSLLELAKAITDNAAEFVTLPE